MWDKIINLTTPEGRALYRLINVLIPQGSVGFLVYFIDGIKSIPADGDAQVVASVTIGALVTAIHKYWRDKSEQPETIGGVRPEPDEYLHRNSVR